MRSALGYNVSSMPKFQLGAQASMGPGGQVVAEGNNVDMSKNPVVQEFRAQAQESAKGFIDGLAKRMASPASAAVAGGKAAAAGGSGVASALSGASGIASAAGAAAPAAAGGAAAGGAGLAALASI